MRRSGPKRAHLAYGYDASLGRPATVSRGAAGSEATETTIAYNDTLVAGFGLVSSRADANAGLADTQFKYDWAGRLAVVEGPAAGAGDKVTQTWRLDGLLATRVLPTSAVETDAVAYDAARRPTAVTRSGTGVTGSLGRTYTRAGATATDVRALGSGTCDSSSSAGCGLTGTATYSYDAMGRLTQESGLDRARSYQYDADGNRTRRVDGSVTTDYTFDRTDQLVRQNDGTGGDQSFGYDAFGGLTAKVESGATTSAMGYSAAGLMTSYSAGGTSNISMAYDALGRLAARTLSGATETYRYAGTSASVVEADTGTAATSTVSLLDPSGARLSVSAASAASPTWALFDALGSMAALVSPAASLSASYRFDGYGQAICGAARASNPYGFTGALNAGTDGSPLYVMGARLYAPSTGAFTSMDTYAGKSADPLSMNRFLYAEANPTTLVDPDRARRLRGRRVRQLDVRQRPRGQRLLRQQLPGLEDGVRKGRQGVRGVPVDQIAARQGQGRRDAT